MACPIVARPFCYRCHKPAALCLCGRIQLVDNRTPIRILQHPRERFHPIGTARIARLGLGDVRLVSCPPYTPQAPAELPEGATLLYPGEGVEPLRDGLRPAALVVLDGTWAHAHTMYRHSPWLHRLPRYGLPVRRESRYRIRREPAPACLSTIEAIVYALEVIEPSTPGLSGLLAVFDAMIADQLGLIAQRRAGPRRPRRPARPSRAIPRLLSAEPERLVVVYGESAARFDGRRRKHRRPGREVVQWTAVRAAGGEIFEELVKPARQVPSSAHLRHLGLDPADVSSGVTPAELQAAWGRFLREGDVLVAYSRSTLDLLRDGLGAAPRPSVLLKAIYCNVRRGSCGTLDEVIAREGLQPRRIGVRGRASRRLGNALALLALLQALSGADPPAS